MHILGAETLCYEIEFVWFYLVIIYGNSHRLANTLVHHDLPHVGHYTLVVLGLIAHGLYVISTAGVYVLWGFVVCDRFDGFCLCCCTGDVVVSAVRE